jgi:ABC-2 type transport system permease protein
VSARVAPRARFRDLFAAEWGKLWSLRSTYLMVVGGAVAVTGLNVQSAVARYRLVADWSAQDLAEHNWLIDTFSGTPYGLLMLIAGTLGALAITGEYSTGLIRTTLVAVPRRAELMAAKAAVLLVVMALNGTAVAGASFWLCQAIFARRGGGLSIGDPGVLVGVVGSAAIPAVCALIGLGIGALLRHTAAALFGVVVVLLLAPEATKGGSYEWVVKVNQALPLTAWYDLRGAPWPHLLGGADLWGVPPAWVSGTTLAAWAAGALAVAVVSLQWREV